MSEVTDPSQQTAFLFVSITLPLWGNAVENQSALHLQYHATVMDLKTINTLLSGQDKNINSLLIDSDPAEI